MKYSVKQWKIVRFCLGLYLFYFLARMIPYAQELFTTQGIITDPSVNYSYGLFPNLLWFIDSPLGMQLFLAFLCLVCIVFSIGYYQTISGILLWYGWVALFNKNNMLGYPSFFFVSWLLLASLLIPCKETIFKKNTKQFIISTELIVSAWIILGINYTISGISKVFTSSWTEGYVFSLVTNHPVAREWLLVPVLSVFPSSLVLLITWAFVIIQFGSFFLYLFSSTRFFSWASMIIFNIFILTFFQLEQVSLGFLLFHAFIFNPEWITHLTTWLKNIKRFV